MNMPPTISKTSFQDHQKALLVAVSEVAEISMDRAAHDFRKLQENQDSPSPQDIAVSFNGTWMRRGHTSMPGVTTVISFVYWASAGL